MSRRVLSGAIGHAFVGVCVGVSALSSARAAPPRATAPPPLAAPKAPAEPLAPEAAAPADAPGPAAPPASAPPPADAAPDPTAPPPPGVGNTPSPPAPKSDPEKTWKEVEDLYVPDTPEDWGGRPFSMSRKMFVTVGGDVNLNPIPERRDERDSEHARRVFAQVGAVASFVPAVFGPGVWLGITGGYSYAPRASMHRLRAGLELAYGPLGVELDGIRFIREHENTWGAALSVFLVIPALYTRTDYATSCCAGLPAPLNQLRSCACDRTLYALYAVPYVRFERALKAERVGRRSEWITFLGLEVKVGAGF